MKTKTINIFTQTIKLINSIVNNGDGIVNLFAKHLFHVNNMFK